MTEIIIFQHFQILWSAKRYNSKWSTLPIRGMLLEIEAHRLNNEQIQYHSFTPDFYNYKFQTLLALDQQILILYLVVKMQPACSHSTHNVLVTSDIGMAILWVDETNTLLSMNWLVLLSLVTANCCIHSNKLSYNLPWVATYSSHSTMLCRQIKCVGGTCTTVMLQQQLRIRLDTCPRTVLRYSWYGTSVTMENSIFCWRQNLFISLKL